MSSSFVVIIIIFITVRCQCHYNGR